MLRTKDILKKLKELRMEMQVRQENMANELGIDRTTYIRKELGAIPITTDEWIALAGALKNVPSYFFNGDGQDTLTQNTKDDPIEATLLTLYRALKKEEKEDLLLGLYLSLKNIKRKKVRNALNELIKNKKETHTGE